MKKTLFLSAILGAALCGTAWAESIMVGDTQYDNVTIVTAASLNPVPASDYYLIGGTTSTDNGVDDYKIQPNVKGTWVLGLDKTKTIIIAPASTVVEEGDPTNYAGYQTFFDSGDKPAATVNANIIAGGKDTDNLLRFWGGNSFTLAGDLTLVGNGVNVWNQNATHKLTGKIIATEGQTLTQVNGSGGTLDVSAADFSDFRGTLNVKGGLVQVKSSTMGIGYGNGSSLKFNADGSVNTEASTLKVGATWASSLTLGEDGRYAAVKNGNQMELNAGSGAELASLTTTGTNGGWIIAYNAGKTDPGQYTDIALNSTGSSSNGFILGTDNATTHIGNLSGSATQSTIRGDWSNQNGGRELAVHQNEDTTFAGTFIKSDGKIDNVTVVGLRSVALTKYGTGTLTLTGVNASDKALTIVEGAVALSGSGKWVGDVTVGENGTLSVKNTATAKLTNNKAAGTIAIGDNADLTVTGATTDITALNLGNGSKLTVGTAAAHDYDLTVNSLTVTGEGATVNANLNLTNGLATLNGNVVTLGCNLDLTGTSFNLDTEEWMTLNYVLGDIDLFTGAESVTLGTTTYNMADGFMMTVDEAGIKLVTGEGAAPLSFPDATVFLKYEGGTVSLTSTLPVPEPATATLSLLALAALASRRRRK